MKNHIGNHWINGASYMYHKNVRYNLFVFC